MPRQAKLDTRLALLGKRYLEKSIHITDSGWRTAPWNSTPRHYQRVEKSAVGGLMAGQIEKILWHGVWDKGNRF